MDYILERIWSIFKHDYGVNSRTVLEYILDDYGAYSRTIMYHIPGSLWSIEVYSRTIMEYILA